MHIIFQRHHIPPDEFFQKPPGVQAFMMSSMMVQLDMEKKARNKNVDEGGDDDG